MNLDETKKYLDHRLNSLGWAVHIDKAGYERIHQHTRGAEERLNQLYYKLVSIGAQRTRREINDDVLRAAIDDLVRMAALLERAHEKTTVHYNLDNDRLSIEQLASELEAAESRLKADRKGTATGAVTKTRVNGAEGNARQVAATTTRPSLLIAANVPSIRAAVTKAVGNNFSIVPAADGEEAWNLLNTNNDIKLVVTDLMMPKLDGFDLIRRIRSDNASPRLAGLPIIVVTALKDTNAEIRALVAGADDFITNFTDTGDLQAHVLARYRLAHSAKHTESVKGTEWRRVSGEKTSPAMSTQPANVSLSRSGTTVPNNSRPSVKSGAPATSAPRQIDVGASSVTSRSNEQHVAARRPDNAGAPDRERPSMGTVDQAGTIASNMEARHRSTVTITLTATILVAIIIAGIAYFERPGKTIAVKPAGSVQSDAPALPEPVTGTRRQPLSAQGAAPEPSKPANGASPTDTAPKTVPATGPEVAAATAPKEDVPISAGQTGSAGTAASSPRGESASTAESTEPAHKIAQADRPIAETRAKSSVAAAPSAKKAPSKTEKPNSRKHSQDAAASAPATAVAPRIQPVPDAADIPPRSDSDDTSVALADRNPAGSRIGTSASGSPSSNIRQSELNTLLKKFVFVYQAGDINQFLSLFSDDVRTNDQTSKAGLREDYEQLFRTTNTRQMVLGNISWDLDNNEAHGWGNFEVKVRRAGASETRTYNGSLTFHVVKRNGRLLIKKLYYGQWRPAAG